MTSRRSIRYIPASGIILTLLVILTCPQTAWVQEPANTAAPAGGNTQDQGGASQGTVALPGAPVTPPGDKKDQPASAAEAAEAAASSDQPGQYVIKEGDTLWDIASAHYRDPFLWPLIWQANPVIADPDLIYPGRQLVIPSLAPVERAMSAPQEPAPVEEKTITAKEAPAPVAAAPAPDQPVLPSFFRKQSIDAAAPGQEEPAPGSRLILPTEAERPVVDKYIMLSAGFVSEEDSDDYIIGSSADAAKTIFGHDDVVYISIHSRPAVAVGDRFLIFQPVNTVKHPATNKYFGELYKILGILKVTKVNDEGSTTATASIILSFDAAEKGSLLMPYQEPTLIYPTSTPRPTKNLTGQILEVVDRRDLNGQVDIVYLDKGKEDGVDPGDRYLIYADGGNDSGVNKVIGEVQVILVKTRTATAVVKKSWDSLSRGDNFQHKN
ncbi:MAG: LysM peptidoglycan-binding domain-containing protein [Nitrospirota bacterium]|nr:LysM peptidoglycan-binding domain-containing protein [Nitrospirota bacterium]